MGDADAWADHVRSFLADYLAESGADGYVVGVSGGIDSVLATRLAVDAVGADRVTGAVLPGDPSSERHMSDAREFCDRLGVDTREAAIAPSVDRLVDDTPADLATEDVGNVRARVRMVMLYGVANAEEGLVVGPDNRSEHLLGYFTKYGDGAADVAPLADCYKTEVYDLARAVGLPGKYVEKTPTAELWTGQSDPGELGATYDTIDPVLRAYVDVGCTVEETVARVDADRETVERLVDLHESSHHKRTRPPSPGRPDEGE